MRKFIYIFMVIALAGCNSDEFDSVVEKEREVKFDSDIIPFDVTYDSSLGESPLPVTRVNVAGDNFVSELSHTTSDGKKIIDSPGDRIRLKIVCPFTNTTQRGESTDGNSSDAFFLLKRVGSGWDPVVAADGYDISATYSNSNSPVVTSYIEAQQTPFVYTAITWTEEKLFIAPVSSNNVITNSLIDQYCNVFHADQSKEKNYRASDVLWAQTYRQTGAWNVHLSFEHKMACLYITTLVDGATPSANAVLTLEGMPDIDQAEIVVGDYYADASRVNSNYGYRQKASCDKANHGKVIGVAVNDESAHRAKTYSMTGNPCPAGGDYNTNGKQEGTPAWGTIPNEGIYTAYPVGGGVYRLIVPPCVLENNATFWLRDGSARYKATLQRTNFKEGELYPIKLTFSSTPVTPDNGSGDNNGGSGNGGGND